VSVLEIKDLTVRYGSRDGVIVALDHVDLTMRDGDFVVAIGASGCGKTTLLSTIAGFLAPTEGAVTLDGAPITGPGADRGVVFQRHALMPWLTVIDNVAFGLKMRGVGKAARHEAAREKLAVVGLTGFETRMIYELSGGMQQRVGVVRALANDPDVLLMDEPFASVDAQTRMTLQEELTRIWQEKQHTVLFITHDVGEAVFLADRVVVLSKGRVMRDIPVTLPRPRVWDEVIEQDEFKRLSAEVLAMVRSA